MHSNAKSFKRKSRNRGIFFFSLLLRLFVDSLLLTPFAPLLKLDLAGNKLLVLATPVVDALALGAGEFYKSIL